MLNKELEFILKAMEEGEMMKSFEQEWDKIRYVFYIKHSGCTLEGDLEGQD